MKRTLLLLFGLDCALAHAGGYYGPPKVESVWVPSWVPNPTLATSATAAQVGTIIGLKPPNVIHVTSPTESAITAAVNRAKATATADVIKLPDAGTAGITISSDAVMPIIGGGQPIWYEGIRPVLTHSGNVPDNDFTFVGGTWFKPTPGQERVYDCFKQQTSGGTDLTLDLGSPDANFTTTAARGGGISNVGIQGFRKPISSGAHNQCGWLWGSVHDVWYKDCDEGVSFVNFQHFELYRLFSYANIKGPGRLAADVSSAVLAPGNSRHMGEFFDNSGNGLSVAQLMKRRGWLIEATAGSNLNELSINGIQANWFAKSAGNGWPRTFAASSFSTNTATFSGQGANFQVNQQVKFTNAGGNSGITTGQTLFVKTVSTDTLTFSDTRNGAAIATSFSSNPTFTSFGHSQLEIVGGTGGTVTNSVLLDIDLEGQAQGAFSSENMNGCFIVINELFANPNTQQHVVMRTSAANKLFVTNDFTTDIDASSPNNKFTGTRNPVQSVQRYPQGLMGEYNSATYEAADLLFNFGTNGFATGLRWKNQSGGGFLQPTTAIGSQYTAWPYAAATLNSGSGSTVVAYNQAATTITLPTIDSGASFVNRSNLTWVNRTLNFNTGILGVTAPGDVFDSLTGKTLANLVPKTTTSVSFVDTEIQNVNGTEVYLTRGYGAIDWTGATATQLSSKSTGATCNAMSGAVTMNGAALNTLTAVTFTLTNNQIQAGDVIVVNHKSAGTSGAYLLSVSAVAAGSCAVTVFNCSGGSLSEAIVLQFKVIKVLQ